MRILVHTGEELAAALAQAKAGDVIELAAGTYERIDIKGLVFDEEVVIRSADPDDLAVIEGLYVTGSENIRFADLEFLAGPSGDVFAFRVSSSQSIHFDDLTVHGVVDGGPAYEVSAFLVRDSVDVSVRGSTFTDVKHALQFLDSRDVLVEQNTFAYLRTDGVRGGGTSDLTVRQNVFTAFQPAAGDHPDAIQLWTTGTELGAQNILIEENVYVRGDGAAVQGIFLRDQIGTLPFEDVIIRNNVVAGSLYNGISVNHAEGAYVLGNVVVSDDASIRPWIRVDNSDRGFVDGNTAHIWLLLENGDIGEGENTAVNILSSSDIGSLAARFDLTFLEAAFRKDGAAGQLAASLLGFSGSPDFVTGADEVAVAENAVLEGIDLLANDLPGSGASISLDSRGALGLVTENGDGTVTYDPNGQFDWLEGGETATDVFYYTVRNAAGQEVTERVEVTISGLNGAPQTEDDYIVIGKGDATSISILQNDSDPDSADTLSVVAINTVNTIGEVALQVDGTVLYDPNGMFDQLISGDTATDVFYYTVSDGNGGVSTGRVTVLIKDSAADATVVAIDFEGSADSDESHGFTGDDTLAGYGGNDTLFGGVGSDLIIGGAGDDLLVGDTI